ncbi:MAG TPA: hypothetical protein VM262_14375 [Acidimicrobiales bacterium]|nr:hypothetical protein [Acidimicrobiales bacterium]
MTRRSKPAKVVIASEVELESEPGERWVRVERSPHLVDEVTDLLFAFEGDGDGVTCRGVVIRTDGAPSGALMRDLRLASLEADAREGARLLLGQKPRVTAAPGAGRAGHPPEFIRQIGALYRYAERHHPRRPILWMHTEGLPPLLRESCDIKTVRRWVAAARHDEGNQT